MVRAYALNTYSKASCTFLSASIRVFHKLNDRNIEWVMHRKLKRKCVVDFTEDPVMFNRDRTDTKVIERAWRVFVY